ncbi:MAG: hypothetical protein HKO53_06710 [Gemmatimonadetes bacterium]|nr:hypothetical protein [Gemmatimonadota bacterium]NNM32738.1 hypothetical protein [Gemmatimonadota bacterium]
MTRRTHNLIGAILCTATALLLSVMAMTGIGAPPAEDGTLTQGVSYETVDLKG